MTLGNLSPKDQAILDAIAAQPKKQREDDIRRLAELHERLHHLLSIAALADATPTAPDHSGD